MATIESIVQQRDDLSGLIVHLTRDTTDASAAENLQSILTDDTIKALSPFGRAVVPLSQAAPDHAGLRSQRCVCFTETPLQHIRLLTGAIDGRTHEFAPYGIAITRKVARERGLNPVWYVDITPGHTWLTEHIDPLINEAIAAHGDAFGDSAIGRLAPFIEAMGSGGKSVGGGYRREFWWEREWRRVGDFVLPGRFLGLCPAEDINAFRKIAAEQCGVDITFVDPMWDSERLNAALPTVFAREIRAV